MSDIQSYRKKPLVVRAIRYVGPQSIEREARELELLYRRGLTGELQVYNPGSSKWLTVDRGDYIILAPTGCRYPVKADQFERNYEAVSTRCDLGVGCEEAGVCYALAHGKPENCPREGQT